jgi:thioredoxin-dependent peroxiredoxin
MPTMPTTVTQTLLCSAFLLAAIGQPCAAALPEGALAPDIHAPGALAGRPLDYSLAESLRKGPVVVYFYPSAFTKGCNLQAHTFSARIEQFQAAGATVVGVSLDDVGRLIDFSGDPEYCAGRLPVVSDPEGRIAAAYALQVRAAPDGRKDTRGADIRHGLAERTTFVVDQDGHIAATLAGLDPVPNVERALAVVQDLAAHRGR